VKHLTFSLTPLCAFLVACASTALPPSQELLDARAAYARTMAGPAPRVTPAKVQEARDALTVAERARSPEERRERAYVARRKAETAEVSAQSILAAERRNEADRQIAALEEQRGVRPGQAEATPERVNTGGSDSQGAPPQPAVPETTAQAPAQPAPATATATPPAYGAKNETAPGEVVRTSAGTAAEARGQEDRTVQIPLPRAATPTAREVRDAYERLAHVASVVDNGDRGWVVSFTTLPFAPDDAGLLPDSLPRLDAVATALRAMGGKTPAVIAVQSSALGSPQGPQALSQRRAEVVKVYLVSRGVDPQRVVSRAVSGSGDRLDITLPPLGAP
jgi:outer membrane protein OmpA-like peptidoglycan-associated protein